ALMDIPHAGGGARCYKPRRRVSSLSPTAPRMLHVPNQALTLRKYEVFKLAAAGRRYFRKRNTEYAGEKNGCPSGWGFFMRRPPDGMAVLRVPTAYRRMLAPILDAYEAAHFRSWILCGICGRVCPPNRTSATCSRCQDKFTRRQRQWRLHHPDARTRPR